jgi:hypothetical protein
VGNINMTKNHVNDRKDSHGFVQGIIPFLRSFFARGRQMQKKKRNVFLALAWSAFLFASLAQSAHAQAIYVMDNEDDVLNAHLGNIQGGITGGNAKTDQNGTLYNDNRNVMAFLGGLTATADDNYNTNHLLQQVMFEIGGCWTGGNNCTTGAYGSVALDKGIGSSTPYFNTNTILRNAFLGTSATEEKIEADAKLLTGGAKLIIPTQVSKDDSSKVMVGAMMKDVLKNADQAVKSAVAKTIPTPASLAAKDTVNEAAWLTRCTNGFNPTDGKKMLPGTTTVADREGQVNAALGN